MAGRSRRNPKSPKWAPLRSAKYTAAATNERSNRKSPISATAGVGLVRLEPLAWAAIPTKMLTKIPSPKPAATAAGAVHAGHGGSSSRRDAGSWDAGTGVPCEGFCDGGAEGGGMLGIDRRL